MPFNLTQDSAMSRMEVLKTVCFGLHSNLYRVTADIRAYKKMPRCEPN